MGAIGRRVAYDFRFSARVPYDYNNPPDELLSTASSLPSASILADVTQEPLIAANAQQRFYFAPVGIY